MNKKNIILILIISIFLSVMIISVLGKVPDDKNRIDATSIVFYNQSGEVIEDVDEDSQNKDRLLNFKGKDTDKDDFVYTFHIEILPIETTDGGVDADLMSNKEAKLEEVYPNTVEEPSNEGEEPKEKVQRFHYYKLTLTPEQRVVTSIRFKYNKGGTNRFGYLRFTFDIRHEEDVGDDI